MNKGISLFFGFKVPLEERVNMIKEAGFTHVITNADKKFDKQNGTIKQQIRMLKIVKEQTDQLERFIENARKAN